MIKIRQAGSKGFTLSRAPNLGKSLSLSVWYPMSRVSLQDSVKLKPLKVGIAEEHPRHVACSNCVPSMLGATLDN
jgi:hypothetical protein